MYNKLKQNKKELEVLGDGNQDKSYFDVEDCIEGFTVIPKTDKNRCTEVYNLAGTKTMKVKELVKIVCDELKVKPKINYTGGDRGWPGDAPYTILSIKKACSIGWRPRYSGKQAIIRTVNYLEQRK